MAKTNKPKGGSVCAVSTCVNYSGKLKRDGITNISFHRFPKDLKLQKQWILKCKRADKWNPSSSSICSVHFKDDAFIRDLQSELLGYASKRRILKPEAIPSLNLPGLQVNEISTSSANRNKRMEAKLSKQAHDEIIAMALKMEVQSSSNQSTLFCNLTKDSPEIIDYECLYRDLLKDHDKLKTDLSVKERELVSVKNSNDAIIKINESLRSQLKLLQKNINNLNTLIKSNQKSSSKQIKQLSVKQTKNIEIQAKKYLSSVFSQNQIDLIMKKKKKVHWSRNEISKAYTLWYLSKNAYKYIKYFLNYPLPGISSLQRWIKNSNLTNTTHVNDIKCMVATTFKKTHFKINNIEGSGSNAENEVNKYEKEKNSIEYLAGWVANRYKVQFPELGSTTIPSNLEHLQEHDYHIPIRIHNLSYSDFIVPSQDFKNKVYRIERLFRKIIKNQIPKRAGIVRYLTNKIFRHMEIEEKYKLVFRTYIKRRIFIKMRYFKQYSNLLIQNQKTKAQLQKMQKHERRMTE